MAWNEPGGSKDQDPWGSPNKDQGPPDLDDVVRGIQDKVKGIFGGKGGGTGPGSSGPGSKGLLAIIVIVLLVWSASGLYIVDEGKRGVVLRFGKYLSTSQAGLHWRIPYPVDTVQIVDVAQIRNVEIGYRSVGGTGAGEQISSRSVPQEALMLTQDENIIDINFAIQYKVKDARDYLFNVKNPDLTLHQATESAVREIIGKSQMDFVLTEGRSEIVSRAEMLIQEILDNYESGLLVTSVNMQDAQPPEQVQAAFSDAVKAREDEARLKNEAEAYAKDIVPKARGAAARMLEESVAYKEQVVAQAEGEADRFSKVLAEYEKAPEVTRERLYLDALEKVMSNTSKVMLDVDGGGNMLLLPLDRIMQGATGNSFPVTTVRPQELVNSRPVTSRSTTNERTSRPALRTREIR
ncbi:MAG: FtsH protease activity modulator HflK [Gammaproteobacteria bacterium]